MIDKVFATPNDALHDVPDGATIMFGGFVSAGTPSNLILALQRRGTTRITGIANNIGLGDLLDVLCERRQLAKFIATFAIRASGGRASRFEEQYRNGEVELELVPQGTFVERIRSGGAGIGGFLTRTGLGTVVQEGKQVLTVDGVDYLLERPLRAVFAFIKAHRADRLGNLQYRKSGRTSIRRWPPRPMSSSPESRIVEPATSTENVRTPRCASTVPATRARGVGG